MSLFGALYSGVSGLQSQSSAMGAIADNITNVNTVGYKNTELNFKTLVTSQVSLTQYSPGGVQSTPTQGVDIQGLLQATTSSTDVGISGQGFFVTNQTAEPNENDLFTYTRAGSFSVDKSGFLQNAAGSYMQGWPLSDYTGEVGASTVNVVGNTYQKSYIDSQGNTVLINDNVIDNRNLQSLNLQTIGGTASPTTTLNVGANLPAAALTGDQEKVNAQVFDSLGNAHNITYTFTNTAANTWAMSIEPPADAAVVTQETQKGEVSFAAGRIDMNDQNTPPLTGTLDFTMNGQPIQIVLDPANPDSTAPYAPGALTVNTTGRTTAQILDQIASELNGAMSDPSVFGTPPTPPGDWARHVAGENGISFDQADSVNTVTFDASITDSTGKQLVSQDDPAGYTIPALDPTYGWFNLNANGGPLFGPGAVNTAAIQFSGTGTPSEFFGRDGASAPDPKSSLEIVWTNGAADMQSGSQTSPAIAVNLGDYNTPDGITQLAGDFQLNFVQQNGAKFGNFAGVSIGKDGVVTALFDNGVTRPIYQIPLASFTNPNGLSSLSGNSWIATDFSGNPTLRQPGDAGAGQVNAAALEASTVDLGTEFTRMITTQRAYSSAAKVITTTDDMLQRTAADQAVRFPEP